MLGVPSASRRPSAEVKGHPAFGPPKTAAAGRTVNLFRTLVEALAAHPATYPPGPEVWSLPPPKGAPSVSGSVRRRTWDPAVAASVGTPCRLQDLRRTHAALLIDQGEHPNVIQARLGHTSISTALDLCGRLFAALDPAAADGIGEELHKQVPGWAWS